MGRRNNNENKEGTFGLKLTKKLTTTLNQVIDDLSEYKWAIYFGGPVSIDTLHYIHQYPEYFDDAIKIADGIYWGGNFETMKALIKSKTILPHKVKFFLGYSGWSARQLEEELKDNSWIISDAKDSIVFDESVKEIWQNTMEALGGKYKLMVHYPTDPQLN